MGNSGIQTGKYGNLIKITFGYIFEYFLCVTTTSTSIILSQSLLIIRTALISFYMYPFILFFFLFDSA